MFVWKDPDDYVEYEDNYGFTRKAQVYNQATNEELNAAPKKDNKQDKKKQDPKQQKQPQSRMSQKETEQRLKLLQQKEKEVQQRLQRDKAGEGGNGTEEDHPPYIRISH